MSLENLCHCLRCDHDWFKRVEARPVRCPNCKQPNWDLAPGELTRGRPAKKASEKNAKVPSKRARKVVRKGN